VSLRIQVAHLGKQLLETTYFFNQMFNTCERFQETAASRQDSVLTSTEDNQREGKVKECCGGRNKSAGLISGTWDVISAFREMWLNLQLVYVGCFRYRSAKRKRIYLLNTFNEPQRHHINIHMITWMRNTPVKTEPRKYEYYLFFFLF